jgi:predicted nucleic acid-binding protein
MTRTSRRLGIALEAGSLPAIRARRRALSPSISARNACRTSALLSMRAWCLLRVLMSEVDLISLNVGLLDEDADVGERLVRTVDAIHLASALSVQADPTAFVAQDNRLVAAAKVAGIETDPAVLGQPTVTGGLGTPVGCGGVTD